MKTIYLSAYRAVSQGICIPFVYLRYPEARKTFLIEIICEGGSWDTCDLFEGVVWPVHPPLS